MVTFWDGEELSKPFFLYLLPTFLLLPGTLTPSQPYLPQLYEQFQTLTKNDLLTYAVKSSFVEGFLLLKYVQLTIEFTHINCVSNRVVLESCGI